MTSSILVVEDDENQRGFLEGVLTDNSYSVRGASNGTEALKLLNDLEPDLMLLDLGLPDISGETVFEETKKLYPNLPVILLTARGTTSDIVGGFNLGADDYITKPYHVEELMVRVRARLTHNQNGSDKLKVGDLELDNKTFEVKRGKKTLVLTPKEFKLLEYLMLNKGQVLSRDMILSRIWMYSPDMETRAVDVYVGYLRKKIDSGFENKLIHTVRGYGYMVKE